MGCNRWNHTFPYIQKFISSFGVILGVTLQGSHLKVVSYTRSSKDFAYKYTLCRVLPGGNWQWLQNLQVYHTIIDNM